MAAVPSGTRPPLLVLLVLLVLLARGASGTTREQYCQLCNSHTMCLYSNVSSACMEGQFERGVSAEEQSTIVSVHNELRNRVAQGREGRGAPGPQPSASNMLSLVWDDEVASVAQRWADQCNYRHDSCRDVPGSYVGQNLYLRSHWPCSSSDAAANWTEATLAWYDEVTSVTPGDVRSFSGSEAIGHYTQLVWATTARVGCGYVRYQNSDWCRKYYVCNYAPGGNYMGQPLYSEGSPRTQCPADATGANPSFRGLCGASASVASASAAAPGAAPDSAPDSAPASARDPAPGSAPGSAARPSPNPARPPAPSAGTASDVPAADPSSFSSPFSGGFNDPGGFGAGDGDEFGSQRRRRRAAGRTGAASTRVKLCN